MGRLIPAGTGFEWYRHVRIPADEPPPPVPQQPAEDDLDLDRAIEIDTDGLPRRSAQREGGSRCWAVRQPATSSSSR